MPGVTIVEPRLRVSAENEISTSEELVRAMTWIGAGAIMGIHAFRVTVDPKLGVDWSQVVTDLTVDETGETTTLDIGRSYGCLLEDPTHRLNITLANERMLVRCLIRDPFEALRFYAQKTGQDASLGQQPWSRFARVLRNTTSHLDFRLREWGYDKEKRASRRFTSCTWRHHRVDKSMVGKSIPFGLPDAIELFQEQRAFARTLA